MPSTTAGAAHSASDDRVTAIARRHVDAGVSGEEVTV